MGGKTECPDLSRFIVSEDGAVYVWGSGGEGQLGMGGKTECPDPSGFIVSEDGAVYVWGSGGEGQLGMGGKTECPDPEELRIEEGVTCISCGYYHTALVSGRCYLDVLMLVTDQN